MTEQEAPREDALDDEDKQETGDLPVPETGNDDSDDTSEPTDTGETEPDADE